FRLVGEAGTQDVLQVDRNTNTVIVQGPSSNVYAWIQVIGAVDQAGLDGEERPTIVPIAPAEPQRIERALDLVRTVALQQNKEETTTGSTTVGPRGGAGKGGAANGKSAPAGDDERASAIGTLDSLDTDSGLFGDVQIEFVNELGLVIVRGGKKDVQRVLEVIE
ncbi:MAG: hypothetical protein ACK53L_32560, partial [Pirellulaceae bacterium]